MNCPAALPLIETLGSTALQFQVKADGSMEPRRRRGGKDRGGRPLRRASRRDRLPRREYRRVSVLGCPAAPTVASVNFAERCDLSATPQGALSCYAPGTLDALVYVTGGFAWAAARQDIAGTLIKSTGSTALFINDTRLTSLPVGWTVGAGGEWACGLHWTLRAEYLFTDLERTDRTFVTEPAFSGKIAAGIGTIGTRRIDNVARVGINYKFAPF
jgi:hypothetical protein